MNVGKPVGTMKSTESDACYFEVDAVFNGGEPVELLEESTWTAGLRRTGNNTGDEVLGFLEFGDVFTARCYASAVLAMGLCPSVCLSVCVCLLQVGVLL